MLPNTSGISNSGAVDDVIIAATNPINTYTIGGLEFRIEVWMAIVVVFLIFLLILTFARLRHVYVGWSFKGFFPAMIFGFLLTLIVEGLMIVSGRTLLTEILGIENAPKPISTALDEGKAKLVEVLGESDVVILDENINISYENVVDGYELLSPSEKEQVELMICKP